MIENALSYDLGKEIITNNQRRRRYADVIAGHLVLQHLSPAHQREIASDLTHIDLGIKSKVISV